MPVTITIPARPGFPAANIYTRISTPRDTGASRIEPGYPTVVFIPPVATDSFFFYPQFEDPVLFEHHNLISFDARGHGLTKGEAGEERYDWAVVADDLEAVLDDLGVGEVHLVGPSSGASAALHFAAKSPERVISMCLVNRPHTAGEGVFTMALEEIKQALYTAVMDHDADLLDNITSAVFDFNVGGDRTPALDDFQSDAKDVYRARLESGQLAASIPFIESLTASSREIPSTQELRRITCPILFLRGNGDGCEPADADSALVEELGRHRAALQVIEGVPRWMTLTSPNIINPILAYHFIPALPSTPTTPLLPATPVSGTRSISRRPSTPRDVAGFVVPALTKAPPGVLTVGDMLDRQSAMSAKGRDPVMFAGGIAVQTEVVVIVDES